MSISRIEILDEVRKFVLNHEKVVGEKAFRIAKEHWSDDYVQHTIDQE
jgi:hypothetical protein